MSQCSKLWSVLNSLIKSVLNVSHPLKIGRCGRAILRSIPGHHQLSNLVNVIVIILKDWYIYCHYHFYIDDNGTQVWVLWVWSLIQATLNCSTKWKHWEEDFILIFILHDYLFWLTVSYIGWTVPRGPPLHFQAWTETILEYEMPMWSQAYDLWPR